MAWEYKGAKKRDRTVRILIEEGSNPEEIQTKDFTWTFDPNDGMTQLQFRAMVKGEVKAHLKHLNTVVPEDDVDNEFRPTVI